ncbi:Type I secretion outer membrane protein, TolC precursor [hydrothermal vent metagenome]|uniref:Type I secretion outer membrane protein, TolC n=1 Tax=hydrothermal vent metagenome TaxID=652676 RepID=A0A3B0TQ44_9ZZZZ
MRLKNLMLTSITLAGVTLASLGFSTSLSQAETLRQTLASAYANNPNIASALISIKASAEDIAIRRSGKLPSIGLAADYSYNWSVVGGSSNSSNSFNIGMTYRQRLFDNLKTDAQIEQARAFSLVASEALRNAEQNVLLSAARAYFNVIRDTKLVQLRADNVSFFTAQVQSARDRLNIGEGTRIEVAQAEARLASGVAAYRDAITSLQVSQANFKRWVGEEPRNLKMDFNFANTLPGSLDKALDIADQRHPAILMAQAKIRAAQFASSAASAAFGPTLDLIGQICAVQCFGTSTTGMSGTVKLTLSIPIYSGGAMGASLRKANLEQTKSEIDALATRDQIREAVISAWNGVQNANAQITSAQSATRSSQLVLNGVIEEQKVGQRTTLDVLNARSDLTRAQEGLISARSARYIATFSLLSSIGRLSARDLNLPVKILSADGYIQSVKDVWADLRSVPGQ